MFLKRLVLRNYRNYSHVDLSFTAVTLLIGDNAQGKSNLLEAISVLSTTKSAKVEKDIELIKQGESFATLEAEVKEGAGYRPASPAKRGEVQGVGSELGSTRLEIGMSFDYAQDKQNALMKRVKVNGILRRVVDYIGNLVVIAFAPEDISLVAGPPALRRWHLDVTLAQVNSKYKQALGEYGEIVTNKNRILKRIKEGIARIGELEFWIDKQIETGAIITQTRTDFFSFLETSTNNLGEFTFDYQPSPVTKDRLAEYQDREIASASSLIGPHRDDFSFKLNGYNLAFFGSRGEQRTAILELKLKELEYVFQIKKDRPILLLDDIFSELDEKHRSAIVSIITRQQTILSAIELSHVPYELLSKAMILEVKAGIISPQPESERLPGIVDK